MGAAEDLPGWPPESKGAEFPKMGVMGNALGQPPNFKWQAPEKTGVAPFAAPTMTLAPKS